MALVFTLRHTEGRSGSSSPSKNNGKPLIVAYWARVAFNVVSTVGNAQTYINPQCPVASMARTLDAPVAMSNRSEFANAVNRIRQRGPTSHGLDRAPAPVPARSASLGAGDPEHGGENDLLYHEIALGVRIHPLVKRVEAVRLASARDRERRNA